MLTEKQADKLLAKRYGTPDGWRVFLQDPGQVVNIVQAALSARGEYPRNRRLHP